MLSKLRRQVGIPGVVAVIALVFVLAGGAYAAGGLPGLNGKQKKEVKKIVNTEVAKHPGPAGPQGLAGAKGNAGAIGPTGPTGQPGEPWTAGGTLPPGATEVGTWRLTENFVEEGEAVLSFPIPLSKADAEHISTTASAHIMTSEAVSPPTGCTGGSPANPKADPGNICVYVSQAFSYPGSEQKNLFLCKLDAETCGVMDHPPSQPQVDSAGAHLQAGSFFHKIASGSFAVTAQE